MGASHCSHGIYFVFGVRAGPFSPLSSFLCARAVSSAHRGATNPGASHRLATGVNLSPSSCLSASNAADIGGREYTRENFSASTRSLLPSNELRALAGFLHHWFHVLSVQYTVNRLRCRVAVM